MDTAYTHGFGNEALTEQYRRAGFGGRVGWGQRPAILVIDMAKAWVDAAEMLGSDLSGVMKNILRILPVARRKGIPIYFTTMAYDPEMREAGSVALKKTPHLREMVRDTERVALAPALERRPDETFIVKPRASAFTGTNILSMLISDRVDTTVVVGCSTSGCIRSTAESGFNESFHVIVPAEAVGDRSPSAHAAALFDIDNRFGDVTPVDEVLAHLESLPDAPRG